MMLKRLLSRASLVAGIALSGTTVSAQLTVAPQTNLQQLAEAISGAGVRITNPVINCHGEGYGEFNYAGSMLGLESGVILSSGRITEAIGPNDVENKTFQQGTPGNALLNTVTGRTTRDACLFEFDIIPSGDSLSFEFVFGSEEYNEWVGSQYNDVFGFFISGPGITGDPGIGSDKNIALVPGTSAPVAINSVNAGMNSSHYQYNAGGQQLQMDGFTTGLVARSVVQPCQTYHLKLIVADASDRKFDSWVFVERIQSPNVSLSTRTVNGTVNMVEGCNPGWIRFTRDPVEATPLTLAYFLQGTATNGTDYTAIGNVNPAVAKSITIPAGLPFVEQPVDPFADVLNEPTEHLRILLGNPNCPGFVIDSIDFQINDTLIATVSPAGTQTICHGSSTQFNTQGGLVYAWSPAIGLSCTDCPNPIASPTTTTTYTVVINEGTCVRSVSRQVRVSNPTITGTVTQPLCNGSSNGAISITVSGGFGPYTFAWSGPNGFTSAQEDLTGLAGGSYSVIVTDAFGCTRTQGFNVGSPAQLALTLNPSILAFGQNIACNGASTGTINLSIGGGTGPYTTQWTGPSGYTSFSQNITGLAAGAYTVNVTDANGCTATGSFNMVESQALVPSIASTQNVTCAGGTNGSAMASVTGGMPPYSFTWNTSPVQNGANATNLAQGSHTVTVTDGYGCTATAQATITQPAPVNVTLSNTSHILHCQGQSQQHASATAQANGGTAPYAYAWNTSPPQATPTAVFISGGAYTVTASDTNGCTGSATYTVNQPGNINTQVTALTNVNCFGSSTGSATVSITGGSAIQSLSWNTTPVQNGPFATNLPAGTWTITAQHADGCVTQVPVTIAQPSAALSSSTSAQSNVTCFGTSTGSATVNANGGTGPYTYSWNSTPVQSGATAFNLPAGTFTCTISDANGCSTTRNVTIMQPAAPLGSSIGAQTNVSCFGGNNGSATVSASGGTSPYSFSWNTSPLQNGATANNLAAGTWTCTITDANGCSAARNVIISQPSTALSSTISAQTNVNCFGGNNGSATVSANGGTAPYSFSWNTSPVQNGATASSLTAGTWTCTIIDANGCSTTRPVTIIQPAAAISSSTIAQTNVNCFGGITGSATVSAIGGTAPYSFSWNTTPAQNGATASNLPAGTWTCTITDASGCSTTRNVIITQPAAALGSSISAQANVNCFAGNTGSATVSASGGTAPYSFSWNTSPMQSGATAANLPAGTFTCTITDANGCSAARDVTITQPAAALSSSSAQTNVNCFGGNNGSASVTATGGTAPYAYSWNTSPVQNTATASNLPAGTWTCIITDANGCSTTRNITITQPAAVLSSTISAQTDVSCFGGNTGSATVSANGGTAPYAFSWNTSPAQNGATASNLPAGNFICTITDANGCIATRSITITQPSAVLASSIAAQTNVLCFGQASGSATVSASGGTSPYALAWNTSPAQNGAAASNLPAGNWTCTITDANGCTTTRNVTIVQPAAGLALSGATVAATCGGAANGAVNATIEGGTAPYTINWSGPGGFSAMSEDISGIVSGIYTLSVTDANGCSAAQAFSVNQPGMFSISATLSDHNGFGVSCANGSDGSIGISVTGGTGPYTHAWSGPNGFTASTQTISAAAPGTYTYTITDSNGCSAAESFTLTAPAPLIATAASATVNGGWNIGCQGAATGSIDATSNGGLAPIGFSWSGPGGFNSSNEDINTLVAGSYTLAIIDANGCTAGTSITLTQAPVLTGNASIIAGASCNGSADGVASANAMGGTAPYAYAWSTTPAQNTQVASDLPAGIYSCTITDANGCIATAQGTIVEPSALAVAIISTTNTLCHDGSDGAAHALASGGTGPYVYSWDSAPAQIGASATGLVQGTYTATATDANGCTANAQAIVSGPSAPLEVILEDYQHETCYGAQDGFINIEVEGGSGSYTIIWHTTPQQFGTTATGLAPGDHWVQVIDNNGCSTHKWHAISLVGSSSPLNVQLAITPISCAGGSDGAVDLTMTGGWPSYTHHWTDDFGGLTGGEDLSGLDAGIYHLHAHDGLGCSYDTTFVLTDPPSIQISASLSDADCEGQPNGAIEITAQGGTGALSFQWTGPNGFGASTEDVIGIAAGSYQLLVTDANGCSLSTQHTVQQPSTLTLSATVSAYNGNGVSCDGIHDGSVDLTITGGSPDYSQVWNGPNGFSSSDEDISALAPGTYNVLVTDGNGCTGTLQATISAPDPLIANLAPSSVNGFGISCNGAADGTIDLAIAGGTAPYAILWDGPDSFSSSDPSLSGLAPGNYTANITDANGCVAQASMLMVEPSMLSAHAQAFAWPGGTNISCAAVSDGAIDLSIIGGVAPFSISWSNGLGFASTDEDLQGLEPGGYQATVTDANGCVAPTFTMLSAPDPISISASLSVVNGSNVTCAGATDGSIDLTVEGGIAPYTIAWSNGASTEDIGAIGAGTYTVSITDANGCTETASYTLTAPNTFDISITADVMPGGANTTCAGTDDGALQASIAGGTAPYALAWSGPNGFAATAAAINGLGGGSYALTVSDANGCSALAEATIIEPSPVAVLINSSTFTGNFNIPCAGLTIGNAQAVATGGTPGYGFAWSGPDGYQSSDAGIFSLGAGSYTVIATDDNGCTGSASIVLQEPEVLETIIAITDQGGFAVSCDGNDGSAAVSVEGGTGPYFIGWTGPDGFASTLANLSGLAAGDYQVTVIDANGCMNQQAFSLDAPEPLSAVFAFAANTCPDQLAGAIDLTIAGGAAPYSFNWSGPAGYSANSEDINGLSTGTYTVQVSDDLGCTGSFTALLNGPAPINSGTYVSFYGLHNLQCAGDSTGAIVLTPSGGTTPFSVAISGPGGFASSSLDNQHLVAGDYAITITDVNGCAMDTTITLTQPDTQVAALLDVSVYPSGTNVSCFGASDGWIDASVSGGSGPYTFDWRGPDSLAFTSEDIFDLPAGIYAYELVVIDANQCAFITTVTLTQPDSAIAANAILSDHNGYEVSCPGATDGTIDLSYSGGNGGFTVQWTGPNGFASNSDQLQGLAAGTYAVTVTDMNGCTLTQSYSLDAPAPIIADLAPAAFNGGMHISCNGANDGSISAVVNGGVGGYLLQWSGPNGFSSSAPLINGLAPGTYCLSITDANGCTAQQCATLAEPQLLAASATPSSASCGDANGAIDLSVIGGTAPFTYAWSNGASSEDIRTLAGGSYIVSVTDANGCATTASAEITSTPPVDGLGTVTHVLCHGAGTGAIDVSVSSGTAPYTYAWSNGASSEDLANLNGGTYALMVTDANGCAWSAQWSVGESAAISIDAEVGSHSNGYAISQHGGSDGSVSVSATGGIEPYSYAWSNGSASSSLSGLAAGTYTITITDANGCTATRVITLEQPNDLVMPTGYTPNSDGQNDFFVVQGLDAYASNMLTILNRWGNVVYERLNYKNDWAGENSSGGQLPNGTYFVILTINNGERTLQGYVDLRR